MTADYQKIRAGQDTPWGVATAFCGGTPSLGGRWACASHGEVSFENADGMREHVAASIDPCLITWRCSSCAVPHGWMPS